MRRSLRLHKCTHSMRTIETAHHIHETPNANASRMCEIYISFKSHHDHHHHRRRTNERNDINTCVCKAPTIRNKPTCDITPMLLSVGLCGHETIHPQFVDVIVSHNNTQTQITHHRNHPVAEIAATIRCVRVPVRSGVCVCADSLQQAHKQQCTSSRMRSTQTTAGCATCTSSTLYTFTFATECQRQRCETCAHTDATRYRYTVHATHTIARPLHFHLICQIYFIIVYLHT